MPYSTGPYARFTTLPPPDLPAIHSARAIDFGSLTYTYNGTTGGFEGMPPTVQRVMMLVLFALTPSKFVDERGRNQEKRDIQLALAELTAPPAPRIQLKSIEIVRTSAGSTARRIVFRDLTRNTGIDDTVQLT